MSLWEDYKMEEKVLDILNSIEARDEGHHLGQPYTTAYQIAILFNGKYGDIVKQLGKQVGGEGIGEHTSLAQYQARELSARCEQMGVEGAFLSCSNLEGLSYKNGTEKPITNSLGKSSDLSMFRIKSQG